MMFAVSFCFLLFVLRFLWINLLSPGISISVWVSSIRVGSIGIGVSSIGSIEKSSISLWLSLSRSLSIVSIGVWVSSVGSIDSSIWVSSISSSNSGQRGLSKTNSGQRGRWGNLSVSRGSSVGVGGIGVGTNSTITIDTIEGISISLS